MSLLQLCSIKGYSDIDKIKEIIQNDPDQLHTTDSQKFTPLVLACKNSVSLNIIELLVKSGSDLGYKYKNHMSAFDYAIFNKDIELARLLVDNGLDVNQLDEYDSGYIDYILTFGFCDQLHEIFKLLVDNGANINIVDEYGNSILMNNLYNYESNIVPDIKYIELFIEYGHDIMHKNNKGKTLLDVILKKRNEGFPIDDCYVILVIKHMLEYISVLECMKILMRCKVKIDDSYIEELDELFKTKYIMEYNISRSKSC